MPSPNSSYTGASGSNNWMQLAPYGLGIPGTAVQGGGGGGNNPQAAIAGGVPSPFFHNEADAARSMYMRTPEAAYPDGLLGTIVSRQNDRLLNAIKARTTLPQYQRGVHKGSRISAGDYFWPAEWNPATGLQSEAAGHRTQLAGSNYSINVRDVAIPPSGALNPNTLGRKEEMRRLMPSTRW